MTVIFPGDEGRGAPGPRPHAAGKELLLAWTGFGVCICLLYGNSLAGWWAWDDSQLLKAAFQGRPWEYYFIPAVWCKVQPANLNPWIILSYDVDLALFGLSPQAFYAHQLLALWLVAGVTYFLLRVWINGLWAMLGVLLFLLSAPVTNTVHQLMTRHYVEGLLFFSLACYLFIRAARDERFSLSWVGAGFYALAMSAKETYVVLALVLPLIPIGNLNRRLRMALPFFLAMGLYALWRRYMLGTWVGGYGPSVDWAAVFPMLAKVPSVIFGDGVFGTAAFLIVAALIFYGAWQRPDVRLLAMGSLLLLLGPIIPAIRFSDPNRLFLLITWALSLTVVLILGTMASSNRRRTMVALAVLAVVGLPMAVRGWSIRADLRSEAQGFEAHGRFVMEAGPDHALLPSAQFGNWFTDGVAWLRRNVLKEQPPVMVYDEIDLMGLRGDQWRVFVYDEASRRVKEVPEGISGICSEWRKIVRDKPISVAFSYTNGVLSWELGPYREGQYSIISYRAPEFKVVVPRIGFRRRGMSDPLLFRIRYDSPEGWIAYSPLMRFDGKQLKTITPEGNGRLDNRETPHPN